MDTDISPLDEALRNATLNSIENDTRKFIPKGEQERIITRDSVYAELERLKLADDENHLSKLADKIWEDEEPSTHGKTTSRKIFSILVLADKVKEIGGLLFEGVNDDDLPFYFPSTTSKSKVFCKRREKEISILQGWRSADKDHFERYQWWMLSPHFQFSCERLPKVKQYQALDQAVLPFIEEESNLEQPPWNEGGFSIVRRVMFHPSHYNSGDFYVRSLL